VSTRWVEIQASDPGELRSIYEAAGKRRIHHFFGEPWFPSGAVVRVRAPGRTLASKGTTWDPMLDQELFGDAWPEVARFFEAASKVGLALEDALDNHQITRERLEWYHRKLIHCALNSWAYTVADERRFHARAWWGRIRIAAHDWGYHRAALLRRHPCRYGCHT